MGVSSLNQEINKVLLRLNGHKELEPEMLSKAFQSILTNDQIIARDTQLGALLSGLMVKGPTADEVITLIKTALSIEKFKKHEVKLPENNILVGLAGSGKKGVKTINISTPAAIIAASAGAFVGKVGSFSTSSLTGSADFMSILGVNVSNNIEKSISNLIQTGFGFFSIENLIPKFDKVYGQRMFVPNPLSYAFPALISPVKYDALLYGLADSNIALSMDVFSKLGYEDVMVVNSTDDNLHFLDEIGLFECNYIGRIIGGVQGSIQKLDPVRELNIKKYLTEDLITGRTPEENVELAIDVLCGKGKAIYEDIICVNAAAILLLAKKVKSLKEGFGLAKSHIHTRKAYYKTLEIIEVNGGSDMLIKSIS
ncbi:anthranilate phosphoribosyltransferase [Bacillus pseudomycoides]|uniref:anthranilate phosphoribosyltransferase n=1 Tax=Bacillus pseudomycoides TaxID=64104 RepID=UPI000BEB4D36|nr:hypothetical protein [Bacillus pseudomycoides]PDZ70803.1 hypothetical protein CON58_26925 [Bacillus pseudomycoides]